MVHVSLYVPVHLCFNGITHNHFLDDLGACPLQMLTLHLRLKQKLNYSLVLSLNTHTFAGLTKGDLQN